MLKGFFKRHKGQRIVPLLKDLFWELRYAFQRAYRGYDFVDVFDLDNSFIYRMNLLLPEFKKHNDKLYTDNNGDSLSKEQTNVILDELIQEFYLADETNFMDKYEKEHNIKDWGSSEEYSVRDYADEYYKHRKRALELFIQHFDWLWY